MCIFQGWITCGSHLWIMSLSVAARDFIYKIKMYSLNYNYYTFLFFKKLSNYIK